MKLKKLFHQVSCILMIRWTAWFDFDIKKMKLNMQLIYYMHTMITMRMESFDLCQVIKGD